MIITPKRKATVKLQNKPKMSTPLIMRGSAEHYILTFVFLMLSLPILYTILTTNSLLLNSYSKLKNMSIYYQYYCNVRINF